MHIIYNRTDCIVKHIHAFTDGVFPAVMLKWIYDILKMDTKD